jgi:hypothetical protein
VSALFAARWHEAARAGRGRARWGLALGLALTNALGLWTHLFHVFVIFAETAILGAAVLARPRSWRERARDLAPLAAADVLTIALFAPWLVVLWRAARGGTAGVPWTRPFALGSLAYYVFAAHFGSSFGPDLRALHTHPLSALIAAHAAAFALAAAAIAVTGLVYASLLGAAVRRRARRWELVPLVAWPLLTTVVPVAYAALRAFPLHPRHLLFVWPLLPIVLGLGLVRGGRLRPLVAAVLALQIVALGNLLFNPRYAKDDERGAVRFAEQRSGAVAYVLGDVAPLYATRAQGRGKGFTAFPPATDDVWLVDNRPWEEENHRARARLERALRAMGMHYQGGTTRFRGIVLRHWTRVG